MSHWISYAQNGEDVLLRRAFGDKSSGFYIDVGASHPAEDSVTKHFYELGWHGINIEPGIHFSTLRAERSRDLTLHLCLSNFEGTAQFYEFQDTPGLSTLSNTLACQHESTGWSYHQRSVNVTTLARLCDQYVTGTIDFVSIDVEGHEREVLEGGDWKRWRPRIVLVEATRPCSTVPTHDRWEQILLGAGYLYATFDGLNRYYVRGEDRHLIPALDTPANVFDGYIPYKHVQQIKALKQKIDEQRNDSERTIRALRKLIADRNRQTVRSREQYEDIVIDLQEKLAALQSALDRLGGLGPLSVAVAHKVHSYAMRMPKISATLKRIVAAAKVQCGCDASSSAQERQATAQPRFGDNTRCSRRASDTDEV